MNGSYPAFRSAYSHEELVEHFLLTPVELSLVLKCRGEANRCGMALLLKAVNYLGHVPDSLEMIPPEVRTFVAGQLGLLWDQSETYAWSSRTREQHLAQIRQHSGWRPPTGGDKVVLEVWLREQAAYTALTSELLFDAACQRCHEQRIELPSEGELRRLVNAALNGFYQDIHRQVADGLSPEVRASIDQLLVVSETDTISRFERLKTDPGKSGVDNFQAEVNKLRAIRALGIGPDIFERLPWKVLQVLKRRAMNETASEMRDHPEVIRYGLIGCFLHIRATEVMDDITRMAVDLIHRLDKRSEQQIQKEWLANLERVEGKMQILSRIAEAVVGEPDGIVRNVIFPRVKEETFNTLVAEFRLKRPQLRLLRQTVMQQKFARHYRRMLPTLLETLRFHSDNRFQPIIEALEVIRRHIRLHAEHFPTGEEIPLDGIVTPKWREKVLGEGEDEPQVNRRYYELCVLEKLEKALKCKEVWVEGSYAFRNPNQDLPGDWNDETCRALHYSDLGKPQDVATFIASLKQRLTRALEQFNRIIPALPHLRIFRPSKKEDRGLWALAKLEPQPEPESLGLIKSEINDRYGMLDLLDVFVEADRLVDFTKFFAHSGTKEMRSRDALRPLLILDMFAEGTNTGIKRVANANDRYSYEELLYVRRTYFSPEALRNANGAVVNKLLALRNPEIWGEGGSSCALGRLPLRELERESHDRVAVSLPGLWRHGLLAR